MNLSPEDKELIKRVCLIFNAQYFVIGGVWDKDRGLVGGVKYRIPK